VRFQPLESPLPRRRVRKARPHGREAPRSAAHLSPRDRPRRGERRERGERDWRDPGGGRRAPRGRGRPAHERQPHLVEARDRPVPRRGGKPPAPPGELPGGRAGPGARGGRDPRRAEARRLEPRGAGLHEGPRRPLPRGPAPGRRAPGAGVQGHPRRHALRRDEREERHGLVPRRQGLGRPRDAHPRADRRRARPARGYRFHHRRGHVRALGLGHRGEEGARPGPLPHPAPHLVRAGAARGLPPGRHRRHRRVEWPGSLHRAGAGERRGSRARRPTSSSAR